MTDQVRGIQVAQFLAEAPAALPSQLCLERVLICGSAGLKCPESLVHSRVAESRGFLVRPRYHYHGSAQNAGVPERQAEGSLGFGICLLLAHILEAVEAGVELLVVFALAVTARTAAG